MQKTPDWLQPRKIANKHHSPRPSIEFERGLNDWKETRKCELYEEHVPNYAYYAQVALDHTQAAEGAFLRAEKLRADIREGRADPDDAWVDAYNISGPDALWRPAYDLGYRTLPLAIWASHQLCKIDIATGVDAAIREWLANADAVWSGLLTSPINLRRAAQKGQIAAQLYRAREITYLLVMRLEDLGIQMRPWVR